ncbi:MlaD family protein [Nocardia sp. AB354]|uniref:MlaD family protein n=1 Tax=Nocardia sp. AB354 TaxID=3413283 RepID=UPI003C1B1ED0
MQRPLKTDTRLIRFLKLAADRIRGNHALLGSVVVTVAVVALVASAVLYVHPPGQKTISFETTDASSLSAGEDVRIAGISVGKVRKLEIGPSTVRAEVSIEDTIFIGADSRVEVRMLTPVGGYAVTVIPIGTRPLPRSGISADHVVVPYSIGDVLQAAPHVTDQLDGGKIDANIDQVADALQHNATSISSIISGMNSVAGVMDRQRGQVRKIMDTASEYLETFNGSREFVFELLREVEIVESTYSNTHEGFDRAYELIGDILHRTESVSRFYLEHKDELLAGVNRARQSIADFQQALGPALDNLKVLRQQLEAWLGPEGLKKVGGGTLLSSQVCIPIPGRSC